MATNLRPTLLLLLFSTAGCMSLSNADRDQRSEIRAIDGLDRVAIEMPGVLEVREEHGIGSYDAILIPDAFLRYRRGSRRLTDQARETFLTLVTDTLAAASKDAGVPIVDEPGTCVMEINMAVIGMNLKTHARAKELADMTMVMQFHDSTSGEPLLRYATPSRIPNPSEDVTHNDQLKAGLSRVVDEMNLAGPLRAAGLADDVIAPECNGTLAALGRAAQSDR